MYELTLKLGEIRQGEESVTKSFSSLKLLWHDLDMFNDYEWKSTDDANHYKHTMEAHRIYKFLVGLNVEFDEVRGRIIGRVPHPKISEVFAEVRREESRQHIMLGKKSNSGTVESSALSVAEGSANKTTSFQRGPGERPWVWCDYCNKPRHTRETYWKIHGKPESWQNNKPEERSNRSNPKANATVNESESCPFSKEQKDHLLKLLKSNSPSSIPSVSLAQTGSTPNAFSYCFYSTPWIIDSEAFDHMTSFSNLFSTYSPCSGSEKIRIADGSFSPIAGKGLVKLSKNIDLKSVLHVPKLACNILSVSKLTKNSNIVFFSMILTMNFRTRTRERRLAVLS